MPKSAPASLWDPPARSSTIRVSVLRDIHDDIDRAVAEAYGWPVDLADEDILFRLVELNAARAAEERAGLARWLRPEFQKIAATQIGLDVEMEEEELQPVRVARRPWPASLPERVRAVRDYRLGSTAPAQPETVARSFTRARIPEVTAILETLTALGQANREDTGYRPDPRGPIAAASTFNINGTALCLRLITSVSAVNSGGAKGIINSNHQLAGTSGAATSSLGKMTVD